MDTRNGAFDSPNAPSTSSSMMPNVLFREIHKNAFLKRHSSDRKTGFPRKSERVWVVFCVHDDVEPFLEIYADQKVALTHKPDWFASLSTALHVSPTICGHEDEFEFAITLSLQVVRLAAPSWEAMMEWVETIRNKLRELKVLSPKENVYSRMPEPKQQLLPTRDPNSPLPLPPEGPSTLLPGVELVHLQSRNGPPSLESNDGNRHSREDGGSRNSIIVQERQAHKRQKDKKSGVPTPLQSVEQPNASSSQCTNENIVEANGYAISQKAHNSNNVWLKNNLKVRRTASVPQPSTSQISAHSNVTVIEVPSTSSSPSSLPSATSAKIKTSDEHHSVSEVEQLIAQTNTTCDNNDLDDVFQNSSADSKSEVKIPVTQSNGDEAHYEHVFLLNISGTKSQILPSKNLNVKCVEMAGDGVKPHSTSVLINPIPGPSVNSSLGEGVAGPSGLDRSTAPGPSDVHVKSSICVNIKDPPDPPTTTSIQTKFEKMNISEENEGSVPKLPKKSVSKSGFYKLPPTNVEKLNVNAVKPKSCAVENLRPANYDHHRHEVIIEERKRGQDGSNETEKDAASQYSQVKKIAKVKVKSEQVRIPDDANGSPVLSRKKTNFGPTIREIDSAITNNDDDISNGDNSNGNAASGFVVQNVPKCQMNGKNCNKITIMPVNFGCNGSKCAEITTPKLAKDGAKNLNPHPLQVSGGSRDVESSTPSTSAKVGDGLKSKNEAQSNGSGNVVEVEPMAATIPPAVGVITVEDIPLIGGHQRRRRRSSSSDPVSVPVTSSSRAIGGADRIRINVPHSMKDDHRTEPEANSRSPGADQIVQMNVTSQSSRLTLREQQVLQLKKEMLHPGGVRLQLRRKDCTGSIALVNVLNGVWVAGWKQKEHPLLYNALHIGDQLISVSDVVVRTAADAQKLIRSLTSFHVEFIIRRVPFGNVFALQRTAEGQPLGIVQEGNTAEIREILPNSLAARQGMTSKTPSSDGLSLTTWFITEINGRPLNPFFKDSEVKDRLNAVGKEISILVQPHDFVKQIKKQLKNLRGYKDYIVQ